MIAHRPPSTATIKQLYARAFSCAYAGCSKPLYLEDTTSGQWVLNSRVCHIHARSENGPRWDALQAEDDNRAGANLVLMCPDHSAMIDEPSSLEAYPADLLRDWKQAQLDEVGKFQTGWRQTNQMAEAVLRASFENVGVAISNSTVNLGGEGGRAPGAGGGGGGAIGHRASAGRGGPGGRIFNGEGDEVSEVPEHFASEIDERSPGAGGGGAGAIGDLAVGGDGGGGGDQAFGEFPMEVLDTIEVVVGKAGDAGRLPGQHGEPGEDSTLTFKDADGTVSRVIRVAGGQSARSSSLPDDWVAISDKDIQSGFRISSLFVANSVETRDGLFFVLGGGWSNFTVPSLPIDAIWRVHASATWRELPNIGKVRGLRIALFNPTGLEVSALLWGIPPEAAEGIGAIWGNGLGAPLTQEGRWIITAESGGNTLSEVAVHVSVGRD